MTDILKLSSVDSVAGDDQIPLYSQLSGGARRASVSRLAEYLGLPAMVSQAEGYAISAENAAAAAAAAADQVELGADKVRTQDVIRRMAAGEAISIACVGNSITWGSDGDNPGTQVATPYPARLQAILRTYYKNASINVINHGDPGDDITHVLARLDDIEADDPDLVIVMLDTNEARTDRSITVDQYMGYVNTLLAWAYGANYGMAFVSAPPVAQQGVANGQAVEDYRNAMRLKAQLEGIEYIDLQNELDELIKNHASSRGKLNRDRLHWSQHGYSLIAEAIFAQGLCNANLRMVPGQQRDIAQLPLITTTGTSTLVIENTLDTVATRIENSSEARFFLWVPVGGCYLMAHTQTTLHTSDTTYQATVENLSLSGDSPRTLTPTTVVSGAPSAAIAHGLPFSVCRLRPGLNEVAFVTDSTHTLMLSAFTVVQGPAVGFSPVWEEVNGKDVFGTSFAGLDTGGIKFISSVVTGSGAGEFVGSDMLIPPQVGETYKVRIRGHFGQNATLRFGQAFTLSDNYNCAYELVFAATQCVFRHRNRVDVTSAVNTVSISTGTSGAHHVIDFFQEADGLTVYVDGTMVAELAHPLPAGRIVVDTGTTTVPSVVEYVAQLGADIAAGAAVPGERWMDHTSPALKLVNAAGSVVSVALS